MASQRFVWYELETADIDGALSFYCPLLGWQTYEFPDPSGRYTIVLADGKGVGGVGALPAGAQPNWVGYVSTPDMDASIAAWTAASGAVARPPRDIQGVGRLALLTDPQGAVLAMLEPSGAQPSEAFKPDAPSHGNWNELYTPDPQAALAFYTSQFGWKAGDTVDFGESGPCQVLHAGDERIGGIVRARLGVPPSWLFHFGVSSMAGAIEAIHAGGGAVLHGPQSMPGGAFVAMAIDPQGAAFAVAGQD